MPQAVESLVDHPDFTFLTDTRFNEEGGGSAEDPPDAVTLTKFRVQEGGRYVGPTNLHIFQRTQPEHHAHRSGVHSFGVRILRIALVDEVTADNPPGLVLLTAFDHEDTLGRVDPGMGVIHQKLACLRRRFSINSLLDLQ